ncbi:MAG: phosphoenolpyruvate synthase [Pseudomonadota bacterium]
MQSKNILWFHEIGMNDLEQVGGKNASLGEMLQNLKKQDIIVPPGFATTAQAFRDFLSQSGLAESIYKKLAALNPDDITQLKQIGEEIRQSILQTPFLSAFEADIEQAYKALMQNHSHTEVSFAVRSSATAEDLPEASFAGQQETFLNVTGIAEILKAIKEVFASLFNDRAISYRIQRGFAHTDVALSAGIQRMVRSDKAASGIMFSIDTESGFKDVVVINGSYGLGEPIVQGQVVPDEFYVYKPAIKANKQAIIRRNLGSKTHKMIYCSDPDCLVETVDVGHSKQNQFCITDAEVASLAAQAIKIESHYGKPMDIEWAKDGLDSKLYIVQARPETVKSREDALVLERYEIKQKGELLVSGRAVGQKIGQGPTRVLSQLSEMENFQPGAVLVTDMTDPDWEPIMARASAIVTNRGGRTCHAAIIARELGIPAVVGCGDATEAIIDGSDITVSCAEGDVGFVYQGLIDFDVKRAHLDNMPKLPFKIMLNVANPDRALSFAALPNYGVGLARLEFIINQMIGVHPKALLEFNELPQPLKTKIAAKIQAYASPIEFFIERLKEGIATIAAAFYPKPVIVRLSDFKSNEYANLLGGDLYEPKEENPMIGFRGASRFVSDTFADCFALECEAIKRVRNQMGLTNVEIMIPFVRTVNEAKKVIARLAEKGLERKKQDLKIIMMCELPSNALLADDFLQFFDGFSIGSNDLTQLTLGLDRDSGIIADLFDERDAAVKVLLKKAIKSCLKHQKYIGICGQGPSDHPDLAMWLMEQGIESVSLNPDSVIDTWLYLAEKC